MSMLFPAYLLGLMGLALPWLLHRFSDQQPEEQLFPSKRFLEPTAPPVSRKRKLKYRILLLLRILSLALLCFLFAQPWLNNSLDQTAGSQHHLVVVDQSLSMRSNGRWQSALAQAERVVEDLPDTDTVQLIGFDNETRLLTSDEDSRAALLSQLNQLQPGYSAADYGNLMQRINSVAAESALAVKMWLITDEQQSALPAQLNALYAPQVAQLELISVLSEAQDNFHLSAYAQSQDSVNVRIAASVSASRSDDVKESQSRTLRVQFEDQVLAERQLLVATDSLESVVIEDIVLPATADPILQISLVEADALEADNSLRLPVRQANPTSVALLSSDRDKALNATVYLSTAFETDSLASVELLAGTADRVAPEIQHLITGRLFSDSAIDLDVLQFVDTGRNALVFNQSQSAQTRSSVINGQQVGLVDDTHPLALGEIDWFGTEFYDLAPFETQPDDTVLIQTTERIPLLIERPTQRGRLLVLNDSLDGLGSNLPFQPAFVELIQSILRYFDASTALPEQVIVGSRIALAGNVQVLDPDNEPMLTIEDSGRSSGVQFKRPGLYTVVGARGEHPIQVMLDAKEADISRLSADDSNAWKARYLDESSTGVNTESETLEKSRSLDPLLLAQGTDSSRFALWQIVLPLMAIALLLESWFGNRRLDVRRDGS